MNPLAKCPHCGSSAWSNPRLGFSCGSFRDERSDLCRERASNAGARLELRELKTALTNERAAHAETRKQYMELIMAVARKFDGETRHQTALRYIKHAEDRARESGKADAEMTRLDAEAKEGQR